VNPLAAILARLAREGFRLEALSGHIAVRPKDRLTPELRDEIIRHRADVLELLRIHGPNLLALFADAPTWPPPRGGSGLLADPNAVLRAAGRRVSVRDGREGILQAVLYETQTGRTRCRVDIASGESLGLDPEDVLPATVAEGKSA
jgi:hypothetical protein